MAKDKERAAAAAKKKQAAAAEENIAKSEEVEKSAEVKETAEAAAAAETADLAEETTLTEEEAGLLKLQEDIIRLEEETGNLRDQLLRKQADFDNFRKRMFREKEELIKYANTALLSDLISVIDDFERAIGSAESSTDFESFLSGIKLIEKQFVGMLERDWGLKRMVTVGKEFDPQEHEALMMEECEECTTQTVLEDFQKGYFLHDRVLRHAKVKVGVPGEAGSAEKQAEQQEEKN